MFRKDPISCLHITAKPFILRRTTSRNSNISGHFEEITHGLPHRKQNLLPSVASQSWNPCSAAPQFKKPGLNGFRTRPRSSSTSRFRCSSTSSTCSAASKQGALDDRNTPTEVRPP
nr:uncharacterized protein LOC118879662 [Drosophila suzukii]